MAFLYKYFLRYIMDDLFFMLGIKKNLRYIRKDPLDDIGD